MVIDTSYTRLNIRLSALLNTYLQHLWQHTWYLPRLVRSAPLGSSFSVPLSLRIFMSSNLVDSQFGNLSISIWLSSRLRNTSLRSAQSMQSLRSGEPSEACLPTNAKLRRCIETTKSSLNHQFSNSSDIVFCNRTSPRNSACTQKTIRRWAYSLVFSKCRSLLLYVSISLYFTTLLSSTLIALIPS